MRRPGIAPNGGRPVVAVEQVGSDGFRRITCRPGERIRIKDMHRIVRGGLAVRLRTKQEEATAGAVDRHTAVGFEGGQTAGRNPGPLIGTHRVEESLPDGFGQCVIEAHKR